MNARIAFFPFIFLLFVIAGCSSLSSQTPTPVPGLTPGGDAPVDRVVVQEVAGSPTTLQAVVSGALPDNCILLGEATLEQSDGKVQIVLPTTRVENQPCNGVPVPFERVIPLKGVASSGGEVRVVVNGVSATFQIETQTAQPQPTPEATSSTAPPPASEPTPVPSAMRGVVWHDSCESSGAQAGSSLPVGCVDRGGEIWGDGEQANGEAGISGVLVSLGSGPCPATDLDSTVTTGDGTFSFEDLAAGTYCVSIDPAVGKNPGSLMEGRWTSPGLDTGQITIALAEGETRAGLHFGWDFRSLPAVAAPLPTEPGCRNLAAFFEDVTIPDDTVLDPGTSFIKTWKIRNEGTCTWDAKYSLVFASGAAMDAPASVPLPNAAPGAIIEVSVPMTAPSVSGPYTGNWLLRNARNEPFGIGITGNDYLWIKIVVSWVASGSTGGGGGGQTPSPAGCAVERNEDFVNQVLELINNARVQNGLGALTLQGQLSAAAFTHSADMACNGFVDHTGSDGSLWYERISSQGYSYSYASENLYVGNPAFGGTPQGAFDWWMDSPVHRGNILNPEVTEIGIGYAFLEGSAFGGYYTTVFARP